MSKLKLTVIGILMSFCLVTVGFADQFGTVSYDSSEGNGLVLNPEGKGDLLLFPYYDVRPIGGKSQDTLFLIINEHTNYWPDDQGIVAKLRFREWDKSEEVFDAEIWLSDEDVWVASVSINPTTGLANITSPDYVVVDYSSSAFTVSKALASGFDFITQNINFTLPPGWTKSLMTHLGYFEVIGEERTATEAASPGATTTTVTRLQSNTDCPNNLMGQAYILRVDDGVAMGYNATAFANFSRGVTLFSSPGALTPSLANAADTLDQMEFQLSKEDIFAAYSIEPGFSGKASVIVTFPTKHFHYDASRVRIPGSNNPFTAAKENDGEVVLVKVYDRDENSIVPETSWWSPPPLIPPLSLPFEVNICGLYPGTSPTALGLVTYGADRNNVAFPSGIFENGWVWIMFAEMVEGSPDSKWAEPVLIPYYEYFGNQFDEYNGLPALALQLQEFSNGEVGGFYGELSDAWYEVDWYLAPL